MFRVSQNDASCRQWTRAKTSLTIICVRVRFFVIYVLFALSPLHSQRAKKRTRFQWHRKYSKWMHVYATTFKIGSRNVQNIQTSKISWINTLALRSGCQSVRRMARVKNCVYRFCILKKPYFILNIRCEICMECMSGMRISCTPVCSKLVANVLTL